MDLSYSLYSKCDRCREGEIESPENLCYYHQKIADGLIDEPPVEIAYAEVWSDDAEFVKTYMDKAVYWSRQLCPTHLQEDGRTHTGLAYRHVLATWNPEVASWATHCSRAIKNAIIDFMRKETLYGSRTVLDNVIVANLPDNLSNAQEMVEEKEKIDNLRTAMSRAMEGMTERQKAVLWQRMAHNDPATQQELADRWGVSHQQIGHDEKAVINKLREEMSNEIQNRYLR